ncbi:MAG: hypothetical protein M9921_03105 [Fimbriimonadaceae bacterium]|nr:proteasome subunit alpha [Chthonomonadaceae bacterium]MCO5295822.1 hypothetical protein [Fimbriimonadaceae bacterium]
MKIEGPKGFAEMVGFPGPLAAQGGGDETHGTTVLALRYDQGVLMLADRRATVGNLIMFDHAEKVFPLDDDTLIAISGAFARSVEVCRYLRHSFKYYRRMTLTDMSLEGKMMEITKALAANMPMAMQGIGVFLPIVAAYDRGRDQFGIYFFDGAGARFENGHYACAGSGSERIRGVFEYLGRKKESWDKRSLDDVLEDGLQMLDIAADLDSATGGMSKIPPIACVQEREGNRPVPQAQLEKAVRKVLKGD